MRRTTWAALRIAAGLQWASEYFVDLAAATTGDDWSNRRFMRHVRARVERERQHRAAFGVTIAGKGVPPAEESRS